jgi:two-component system, cell cycle sensor histidine kinase and response regulator CckA
MACGCFCRRSSSHLFAVKRKNHFLHAERLASTSALASRIAHDLNKVISPILIGVPLLKETTCDPVSRKILSDIESSADRGAEIVKQYLSLAGANCGESAVLRPNDLIREMVKLLNETFPKSIRIETRCDLAVCEIEGDALELHQVLMNLCVNARDAMPDGGVLTLSSRNATLNEPVSCAGLTGAPGPYAQIQVADTGVGISEELRGKIFQPYFTTKGAANGAGLGLSTAVRILQGRGALLGFESAPERGTTFSVYFPARARRPQPDAAAPPAAPSAVGRKLVLLVDDEAAIRELCKLILEGYDYRVLTAENGAEALSLLERHKGQISAAIVDMMMPILDGPATIRAMRWSAPQLKIIAATGLVEAELASALGDTASDFALHKPYTAEQLLAALASVLQ